LEQVVSNMVGLTPITNQVPINRAVSQLLTCESAGRLEDAELPIADIDVDVLNVLLVRLLSEEKDL
jgi:hypothetical protein